MKGSIFLLCVSVCLLLILLPNASAACNRTIYPVPVTTYWPPGPDGTISVETSPPGAVIYLNGDNKGRAPVAIRDLWPGTYTISAVLPGYEEFTSTTTISGPTRSVVYCRLIPDNTGNGLYIMSSPDGANVYLDGTLMGKTPIMLSDTTNGSHTVQLRLSGYNEWKSTVVAPQGGTKTLSAILYQTDTDLTRGLNVSSNPNGARVMLDGLEKGVTPVMLNNIVAGIHILELEYSGYKPWKSTVDVPETEIKELVINLTPTPDRLPGGIKVSSSPGNASVTLDGNYVGLTPVNSSLNLDTVTPGEHTIVLALAGYKSYSTLVTVLPSQVSSINATLMPVSGPLAKGTLSVTTEPAGATITVDNGSAGISPLTAIDIAVGDHKVTIQMDGYQDYSTNVFVTAGTTRTISATLLPVTPPLHSPQFPLSALCALGIICFIALRKNN